MQEHFHTYSAEKNKLHYEGLIKLHTTLWLNPGEGETPQMKVVGMLVVSVMGVNFGFWSHLRCSGQNAIIFSREGLV